MGEWVSYMDIPTISSRIFIFWKNSPLFLASIPTSMTTWKKIPIFFVKESNSMVTEKCNQGEI